MVTNFEEITNNLTDKELVLLPVMIKGFCSHTKSNPIKAAEIVANMKVYLKKEGSKIKMSQPLLRKFVNHIRTHGLLPLIATSEGYYVCYDPEIINEQILSLYERASSIKRCADGLYFLANKATL